MKYSTRYFWGGILTMALGLIVLFNAAVASGAIVIVTGLLLLIGGGAQITLGFIEERSEGKWLTIALGVFTLLLGWFFLSNPLSGVLSLTTFLLILMAISGTVQIIVGFRARGTPFFWPFIIAGLVSLLLAVILLSSSAATMRLLGVLLGFHMLATGASLTILGMFAKKLGALSE